MPNKVFRARTIVFFSVLDNYFPIVTSWTIYACFIFDQNQSITLDKPNVEPNRSNNKVFRLYPFNLQGNVYEIIKILHWIESGLVDFLYKFYVKWRFI